MCKARGQSKTGGLKGLASQFLNRQRSKVKVSSGPRRGTRSDWLASNLSNEEIMYAADDAQSAVQIFAVFMREMGEKAILKIVDEFHMDSKYRSAKYPFGNII